MEPDYLFHGYDIHSVIEHQKATLRERIQAADQNEAKVDDQSAITQFLAAVEIKVPVLDEGAISVSDSEIDVDVSGDPRRMFLDPSEPYYVKGTKFTFHIPFTGDDVAFRIQPQSYSLNRPMGIVDGEELQLSYEFAGDVPGNVKARFQSDLVKVKANLENIRQTIESRRGELVSLAQSLWARRKMEFVNRASTMESLGFPRREAAVQQPPPQSGTKATSKRRVEQKWDVFISHAKEDKAEVAKPLAEELRKIGLCVWYDEFTLTVGDSLRQKIDQGLAKSRYGVVILSEHFFAKHWPQQELNGLATREVDGTKVILPVWHKIGRQEVAAVSPTLADRLAALTSNGMQRVVEDLLSAMGR